MDYGAFFTDVAQWIGQANQAATRYGMGSSDFWVWAFDSSSALCEKYQQNPLAIKQMFMLIEWLESVCENKTK